MGEIGPGKWSRPAGLRSMCQQLAESPPDGGAELTTDPPPGAPLRAGQPVTVTLRWDEAAFAGPDLEQVGHRVVTLDGRLRLDLSSAQAPSVNDGGYRGSFVVPADLTPGECLCVLGVASGEGGDGGFRQVGGNSCITLTAGPPTNPPPATSSAAPATPEATPPVRQPNEVLSGIQTAPAGPQPLTELPRTGPSETRLLLAVAGLALVLGGGGITTRR